MFEEAKEKEAAKIVEPAKKSERKRRPEIRIEADNGSFKVPISPIDTNDLPLSPNIQVKHRGK